MDAGKREYVRVLTSDLIALACVCFLRTKAHIIIIIITLIRLLLSFDCLLPPAGFERSRTGFSILIYRLYFASIRHLNPYVNSYLYRSAISD
jgi:hypothetical protein